MKSQLRTPVQSLIQIQDQNRNPNIPTEISEFSQSDLSQFQQNKNQKYQQKNNQNLEEQYKQQQFEINNDLNTKIIQKYDNAIENQISVFRQEINSKNKEIAQLQQELSQLENIDQIAEEQNNIIQKLEETIDKQQNDNILIKNNIQFYKDLSQQNEDQAKEKIVQLSEKNEQITILNQEIQELKEQNRKQKILIEEKDILYKGISPFQQKFYAAKNENEETLNSKKFLEGEIQNLKSSHSIQLKNYQIEIQQLNQMIQKLQNSEQCNLQLIEDLKKDNENLINSEKEYKQKYFQKLEEIKFREEAEIDLYNELNRMRDNFQKLLKKSEKYKQKNMKLKEQLFEIQNINNVKREMRRTQRKMENQSLGKVTNDFLFQSTQLEQNINI